VLSLPGQLVHPLRVARERRDADRALLASNGAPISATFAWRIAELTAPRERLALAHSLRDLVDDLSSRRRSGDAPLNRAGLLPHASELLALAARLERLEVPVSPRGVLLVRELLTDGGSPLFLEGDVAELRAELARINEALDAD
jgi:hypothetical protein